MSEAEGVIDRIHSTTEDNKPKPMNPVGKTLSFPRLDNVYTHKESLPYDEAHSLIWRERPR